MSGFSDMGKHNPSPPQDGSVPLIRREKIPSVNARLQLPFALFFLILAVAAPSAHADSKSKAAEESGAILFRDKGCAYCHGVGGTGGKKGPNLADIRTDKLWPAENITKQILNGGQKMPPFADSLTDTEIQELVAYLRAKKRPMPPPPPPPPAPAN